MLSKKLLVQGEHRRFQAAVPSDVFRSSIYESKSKSILYSKCKIYLSKNPTLAFQTGNIAVMKRLRYSVYLRLSGLGKITRKASNPYARDNLITMP
jgi:hypothetical protein